MEYSSRAYALVNKSDKRHFKEVSRYLAPKHKDRILEIGCGRGFLTREVQAIAPSTLGVDINPEAVKNGVTRGLTVMSADDLKFSDDSFNKVYSMHVIEHVPNMVKVLDEIERVLVPGGRALLAYPAEPVRGLFSIPAAIVIFKNPFKAREIHVHKISPIQVKRLVEGTRLRYISSRFSFFSTPQYYTLLEKRKS